MKKNCFSKGILAFLSVFGVAASTSMYIASVSGNNTQFPSHQNVNNDVLSNLDTKSQATTNDVKPLIPAQSNGQNSFLSTPQGPLVYWNNKITSLDWFGAERWSIDFSSNEYTPKPSGGYGGSWIRAWFNWDYDRNNDILWVLGYGASNVMQKLWEINATTGELLSTHNVGYTANYKFISALSSGNVLIWSGASTSYNATAKLYQKNTNTITDISGNSANIMSGIPGAGTNGTNTFRWYYTNTIPVKSGWNLVVLLSFATKSTQNDDGAKYANYDVYFVLVDDNLNMVANTGKWAQPVKVMSGLQGYRNTTISAQRDYYQLLDGRVATVIYNNIVIINPNDVGSDNGLSFSVFTPSQNWILSWSFDTNENLFYKYKNDSKIYKIGASTLSTGSSSSVTPYTYYDLSSANNESIKKYANNFVLYNVYGYQGQIMLINASYNDYIDITKNPDITSNTNPNEYGLAVAITQNPNNENAGDSKGLLNTENAFQFSADFSISDVTLNSKLPSEIVPGDLVITNDGFLTNNTKFTAFSKVMDDSAGTLTVTAYIDQIPWFVSNGVMPSNINPTRIEKSYTNLNKVATRISWKSISADYDFANTLPTKVDQSDLTRFDPATFNINSQTVADSSGNIIYPKKTYTIESKDDNTGNITIKAKYDYMPLGMPAIENNALSISDTHEYTIFKVNDPKQFIFTGKTTSGTDTKAIDINNVPQLASLLQSDVLPSSFVSTANSSSYLQFVNTDLSAGYPTSKMSFFFTADNMNGTLTITAKLPDNYYPDSSSNSFSQIYSGLNKSSNYQFNWLNKPTLANMANTLPSEIAESQIFSNFTSYRGFNPLDMSVRLFPDDDNGTLSVQIVLNGNYPENIKTANRFSKVGNLYIATQTFSGFMTNNQKNNQYKLVFKSDSDQSLNNLKKLTTQQIYNSFYQTSGTPSGLELDGKKYSTLKDLIGQLLISSSGISLPQISDSSVTAEMYYNNGNGTADFVVKYPESVNSLIFVGSFTGFVLGNDVPTTDVLSFKTQTALETEVKAANAGTLLYKLFDKNVFEAATWIENNLTQFVQFQSGQYQSLINSKSYTINISTNEIYGTVSAIVKFTGITNNDSVSL
ncbi:MAG: hypothetical protein K2I67_01025, partial [Malacoplasma sp.]|nr:hypothetical protein [Malacoplasma sp.]